MASENTSSLPNNILAWSHGGGHAPSPSSHRGSVHHTASSPHSSSSGANNATAPIKIRGILQREGILPANIMNSNNNNNGSFHGGRGSSIGGVNTTAGQSLSGEGATNTNNSNIAPSNVKTGSSPPPTSHPFCRYFKTGPSPWTTSKYAHVTLEGSVTGLAGRWAGPMDGEDEDDEDAVKLRLTDEFPPWRRTSDALQGWSELCTGGCVRRRNATASQLLFITQEDVYDEEEEPLMEMPCDKTILLRSTVPMPRGRTDRACVSARFSRKPRKGEGKGPIAFVGIGLTAAPNEELKGFPLVVVQLQGEEASCVATVSVATWRVNDQDVLELCHAIHAPSVVRTIRNALTLKLVVQDGAFDVYANDNLLHAAVPAEGLKLGDALAILVNSGGRVLASQIAIAEGDRPPESRLYQHMKSASSPKISPSVHGAPSPTKQQTPAASRNGGENNNTTHHSGHHKNGTAEVDKKRLASTDQDQADLSTGAPAGRMTPLLLDPMPSVSHGSNGNTPESEKDSRSPSTSPTPQGSMTPPSALAWSLSTGGRPHRGVSPPPDAAASLSTSPSTGPKHIDPAMAPGTPPINTSVVDLDERPLPQPTDNSSTSSEPRPFLRRGARKATTLPPSARARDGGSTTTNPSVESQLEELPEGIDRNLAAHIIAEVMERSPNVPWEGIAGVEDAKRLLKEAVLLPLLVPELFVMVQPWRGVLLYGPPGTGKTMLAKAVATSAKTTFFSMSAATLNSKHYGESEKLVRTLFQVARHFAPSTIFFDEVDALMSARGGQEHEASRRVKSEMLLQMDGLANTQEVGEKGEKRVLVLATTNRPWDLDDAMRRRLEKRIYIPLPDAASRAGQLQQHAQHLRLGDDVDMEAITAATEGFSGADLSVLVRDAAMAPVRSLVGAYSTEEILAMKETGTLQVSNIVMTDFLDALKRVQPSVAPDSLQKYSKWSATYGST